jgi:CspA family cold shock protein
MNGIIKKIVADKGFGFIRDTSGKEYFFHRSALKNCEFTELKEGREVEFDEAEGSKGPRAEDVYV